ncbi:helix-turn-helix domain-containing protein [Collinsella tanakaei]|uniref:helix-turn-helix domain-containing protein n=1 Tax=Collinsella tanakaei TaxID=626935 RepID=UPI0025A43D8E|nr:helix-turn-helix transcriptional regulator [Collinsella tanakaei]MDM8300215.1 helix-turn-helix transcriptional regulator [Collinsella tanakaei]
MDNVREKRALGSNIQAARAERGISQRQLALMTGTSRSYLWRIEIGAADVGIDVLIRIAQALDVPLHELIDF